MTRWPRFALAIGHGSPATTGSAADRRGMTLVELLVVIAIICILMGLLFPVFHYAREKGRQAMCLSNQRQIAMAILMQAQDAQDLLPQAGSVWQDINVAPKLLRCPTKSDLDNGYAYNSNLSGKSIGNIDSPTTVLMTGDGGLSGNTASGPDGLDFRHGKGVVASYVDGHVAYTKEAPAF